MTSVPTPPPVRVLLVEDDEDDVVLARRLLADVDPTGFAVEWVADYAAALDRLCAAAHDVCLVDYRLGASDGVQFVRDAAARDCRVPIILLTGTGDRAVDVAAMNAGAADFLHKADLKAAELERSIRYAMQHRRSEEQRIKLLTEQTARAKAEAANQAKDDFLAALSHELRTPLAPVLMAVDELGEDATLPDRARELIALVRRNVELEARLIDDLLDLTRVAHRKLAVRREVVDVHAQLRYAVDTCKLNQPPGKRLDIDLRTDARTFHVLGDPTRVQQVFWNLVNNAIKFTPDGGRIVVRTIDREGGMAVEVKDTGVGIAPGALPRIFNAFEQGGAGVTRQFGGLGLGLAICRALVELHAGTIRAASDGPGTGATFTVELPTVAAPRPAADADRPVPPRPAGPGGRILLVEDHPDTRALMAKLLTRRGHQVTTAGGVEAALEVAREMAIDLVISDIGLPDGTGLDLMRRLRERGPVRGIALSGYGMEHDVRQSEEAGFLAHLVKPVNIPQLHEAIARILTAPVGDVVPTR